MKLKYLKQRSVTDEYRITLPEPVKNVLYPDEQYGEKGIYWNLDKKYNDIIISTEVLYENQSGLSDLLTVHESGGSVSAVVPEDVRTEFGISKGDDLYLIAPEGVSDVEPTTFIWTFEKIESIILSGDDKDLGDFPRRPEF
jgi:bifunctional DNA-binding transcriptional regulator/antitoxin component of YhaV-PrlF toxin-antitoxin module